MGLTDGTNNMVMPVSPMYNNGGYGNGMFGGDYMFWFVILILAMNGGWGNGFGNNAGGMMPYMMNNNTNNDVQRGFDQQSVMNGINTINSNVMNGFAGVNQSLCSSSAGITAAINNGFAQNEISNNARQMADMQQNFQLSQQLSQCCCDNRLATANLNSTILAENCADRQAVSDGLRDVTAQNTANTNLLLQAINGGIQSIQDTFCQNKIDEKNERIRQLENQNTLMTIRAEALANRNMIVADNLAQTQAIENWLSNAGYSNNCCGGCR